MIIDQRTTDEQLRSIRTKHLRAYAIHSRIQIEFLLEKQDLINCIQQQKRGRFFFPQSSSNNQDQQVRFNGSSPVKVLKPRVTLEELSSLESMDDLSVGQLKEILQENFVSMKGCLEKKELIEKVRLLYHDRNQSSENSKSHSTSLVTIRIFFSFGKKKDSSDENLCKVCWDAIIDCVFLDCGHLCTCIQCGKQLSQCPICRSYIVRLVRVFKS